MPGNSGAGVFGVVNGIDDQADLIIGQPDLFITCMHTQILRHDRQSGNN
jgi:hypothetical protein